MLALDISHRKKTNNSQSTKVVKRRKRSRAVVELDDVALQRLSELEEIISSQLGNGAFFLVAISLKEIDEKCLYVPESTVYTYAKNKFSFSRRTTNTYLCSASVYESIIEDPSLPIPSNISHIRSLHKYTPEVRRYIWRQVCESTTPITEEQVVAMTVKYETGVSFSDLANELYTPPEIIAIAKRVIGRESFDLDPASCLFANRLHSPILANNIYDETDDGLVQKWTGDVWLSPPFGIDKTGVNRQAVWFYTAESKFLSGEIKSCQILLKIDYGNPWMAQAMNYPHCQLNFNLQFSTPTGREKSKNDGSFIVLYMGNSLERFCSYFSTLGFIPGYNSWSFRPYLPTYLMDEVKAGENQRMKHQSINSMILPNSKEILDRCFRGEMHEHLINSLNTLAEPINTSHGTELLSCDHTSENSIF